MTTDLIYKLNHGFIDNWLISGPLVIPLTEVQGNLDTPHKLEIIKQKHQSDPGFSETPVDLGSLGSITAENPSITWKYFPCLEDHMVDFTSYHAKPNFLRSWAFTQLSIPTDCEIEVELVTNVPVDFWLNGQHQCHLEDYQGQSASRPNISGHLNSGLNQLLFQMEYIGSRTTSCWIRVRIEGSDGDEIQVVLPTDIESQLSQYRINAELLIKQAYLDRYVFGNLWGDRYNRNQSIPLMFSTDTDVSVELTIRLQSLSGDIFQEGTTKFGPGACHEFAEIFPLRNGPHHLLLMPTANAYYVKNVRVDRKELFHVVRTSYAQKPQGNYMVRVEEALTDASQRRNESIYCEIAKIATDQSKLIEQKVFTRVIEGINLREDGSVHNLLGILGLMFRFRKGKKIPTELKTPAKKAILNYRYWHDEPGIDVMDFQNESVQILFHVCEILAGQLYSEKKFPNNKQKGKWHQDHGQKLAIDWLQHHGQFGFQDWDSPSDFEAILAALSHLVDLSNSEVIRDLAAVVMDKILFTIAINSFQGAYGSTRGRTDTAAVLSARLEPTSGISRLMWGMGNFNESLMGTVSLACCKQYEMPEIIQKIGEDTPAAFWSREHQGSEAKRERLGGVDKVCYRTKDFLLSSAQDYRPGEKGFTEHIWQATLGPDSIIYVNHPACMSVGDVHKPNIWCGNGVLPRVVQWGDVLISVHKLPPDDLLGFTHAYFPAVTFDEYQIEGKWAFARKGNGYLALYAANGMAFLQRGQTAFRELRSQGYENIWLCHMGQQMLDGSFEEFKQKILDLKMNIDSLSINFTSLRGDSLCFGWDGPFWVNDQEQQISGFRHYENIYCIADMPATQMDIVYQEEGIRLNFV